MAGWFRRTLASSFRTSVVVLASNALAAWIFWIALATAAWMSAAEEEVTGLEAGGKTTGAMTTGFSSTGLTAAGIIMVLSGLLDNTVLAESTGNLTTGAGRFLATTMGGASSITTTIESGSALNVMV